MSDRPGAPPAAGAGVTTVVVPCYNEAERLDDGAFIALAETAPDLRLLFVNDGSTDGTEAHLRALAARRPERIGVRSLSPNGGKAEAVRQGLLEALGDPGTEVVGYLDADLSTPPAELARLGEAMQQPGISVVMGSRVALLGNDIHRTIARHYLGRVFASAASLALRARVYDTQCGAKLFRRSPALEDALATPFRSRWAFDVELLGRILAGRPGVVPGVPLAAFVEVPLRVWRDVPGSKLRAGAMAGALKDLALIGMDLARRRRDPGGG